MTRTGRGATNAPDTDEFDVGDIHCYLDAAEPGTCYCIPGAPMPERDASGEPTLSLWVIPAHNRLQLAAQWALSDAETAAVQSALQVRGHHPGTPVTVATAPLVVDAAVVLLGDEGRPPEQIATSKSSGYGANSAVFTAVLDDAHTALVTSALNGAHGRLFIEYQAQLDRTVPVSLSLAGDVRAELGAATAPLSDEQAREVIERAIAAGHLALTRHGPDTVPDDVWGPLHDQLIAGAVQDLQNMASPAGAAAAPGTATLHREVGGSYHDGTPVSRRADIADWFPGGASRHIRVLSIPQSGRQ
jgi:hypothetical protein